MQEPLERLKDLTTNVICAGPPQCPFEGEDMVQNMDDGCPLCERVVVHSNGATTVYRLPTH